MPKKADTPARITAALYSLATLDSAELAAHAPAITELCLEDNQIMSLDGLSGNAARRLTTAVPAATCDSTGWVGPAVGWFTVVD